MPTQTKIVHQEYSAVEVVRYFAKDFKPTNKNDSVYLKDWFYDPVKRVFIFVLVNETSTADGATPDPKSLTLLKRINSNPLLCLALASLCIGIFIVGGMTVGGAAGRLLGRFFL